MSQFDYRRTYRRNLPHIQPPGASFFLTFRLAGSLPHAVVVQWKREQAWLMHLAETNAAHYQRVKSDFERVWFTKFESLLDGAVVGPVWLSNQDVASSVAEALHYRDGKAYRLDAFTIMSNHVHAVVKPLPVVQGKLNKIHLLSDNVEYRSLARITQSLKGCTAFKANRILRREGEFWAHESYDHWVRDAQEKQRIIAYTLNNPLKAGYVQNWRDWKWSYRRA
ncbi:MAG TPA: hypothetical protein VLL54_11460 [Pyrinomonadaceae bacterium]|nr:hypothetical protein [Pyrinomonadaceae bacterium]